MGKTKSVKEAAQSLIKTSRTILQRNSMTSQRAGQTDKEASTPSYSKGGEVEGSTPNTRSKQSKEKSLTGGKTPSKTATTNGEDASATTSKVSASLPSTKLKAGAGKEAEGKRSSSRLATQSGKEKASDCNISRKGETGAGGKNTVTPSKAAAKERVTRQTSSLSDGEKSQSTSSTEKVASEKGRSRESGEDKSPSPSRRRSPQLGKITTRKRSKRDSESPPPQKVAKVGAKGSKSNKISKKESLQKKSSATTIKDSRLYQSTKKLAKKAAALIFSSKKKTVAESEKSAASINKSDSSFSSTTPTEARNSKDKKKDGDEKKKPVETVEVKPKAKPEIKMKLRRTASLNAEEMLETINSEPSEEKQRSPAQSPSSQNTENSEEPPTVVMKDVIVQDMELSISNTTVSPSKSEQEIADATILKDKKKGDEKKTPTETEKMEPEAIPALKMKLKRTLSHNKKEIWETINSEPSEEKQSNPAQSPSSQNTENSEEPPTVVMKDVIVQDMELSISNATLSPGKSEPKMKVAAISVSVSTSTPPTPPNIPEPFIFKIPAPLETGGERKQKSNNASTRSECTSSSEGSCKDTQTTGTSVSFDASTSISTNSGGTDKVRKPSFAVSQRVDSEHTRTISCIKFSPNGLYLATASFDHQIRIWETPEFKCTKVLMGHMRGCTEVAWSSDSALLVSASEDSTLKVWDVSSGLCIDTLIGHSDYVFSCDFNMDSTLIVSGSLDRGVRLWDTEKGICTKAFVGHTDGVTSVRFHPEGKIVASSSFDKTCRIWDVETGKCLKYLFAKSQVTFVAFPPNDRGCVLFSSMDDTIRLWRYDDGKIKWVISGSEEKDPSIFIWDYNTGKLLQKLMDGTAGEVFKVACHPTENIIVSACMNDHMFRVWKENKSCMDDSKDCLNESVAARGEFQSDEDDSNQDDIMLEYEPEPVAAPSKPAMPVKVPIRIVVTNEQLLHFAKQAAPEPALPTNVIVDKNAEREQYEFVRPVTAKEKPEFLELVATLGSEKSIQSPKGNSSFKRLRVNSWAVVSEQNRPSASEFSNTLGGGHDSFSTKPSFAFSQRVDSKHTEYISCVKFSPNGLYLASASLDHQIRIWETAGFKCKKVLIGHKMGLSEVAWSSNSGILVSASDDKTVKVWDVDTGICLNTLEGHASYVLSCDISLNSELIISGSYDGGIRLWYTKSGQCARVFEGHKDVVTSVRFDPTGVFAVSTSYDKICRVWDIYTEITQEVVVDTGVCFATFAESKHVIFAAFNSEIQLWKYEGGYSHMESAKLDECRIVRRFKGHVNKEQCINVNVMTSGKDKWVVSSSEDDASIFIWDYNTGKLLQKLMDRNADVVLTIACHPTKNMIVSACMNDNAFQVWKA